tara:strand:- start:54 stop:1259 length:1206 start_codon:yes stop_codon:yes gene_type:complete
VPTEYGANQYVNEFYNIRATIDGLELPGIVSLNFKHKVNSARVATLTFSNRESLEMLRIGGILKINFGLSDAYGNKTIAYEDGTNMGLIHTPYPNDFYGKIKVIRPSFSSTTVTAMDLVSDLITSTAINIQWRDYGTQDMYYVARDICDHAGIDTSLLTESTKYMSTQEGGKLQADFNIYGVQTRGSFLNKLFDLMTFNPTDNTLLNPTTTARGAYMSDPLPFIQFYYAIRQDNKMEFFSPNRYDKRTSPVLKVSANEANIVGDGLVGQIDSSTIINSVTVTSSKDETKSITLEDQSSIDKYGVFSKAFGFDSTNKNRMREFAYLVIQNFKMPTNTYKMQLTGAEWVQLGDIVEISSPLLGTKEKYPVIEKEISVSDSVVTRLALGKRSISTKKLLELVQR